MAYSASTQQILTTATGWAIGTGANKEDVADYMTLTDPTDTPGMARFGNVEATGITHEWLDRGLKSPYTAQTDASGNLVALAGGVKEGSDFNAANRTAPVRRKNRCQIFKTDFQISRTQARVATYGIRNKLATESRLATQEVLRAIEARLWMAVAPDPAGYADANSAMTNDATHPERRMTTLWGWLGLATTAAPPSGSITTAVGSANTPAGYNEDDLLDLFMKVADQGGRPNLMMCHHRQKRRLNRLLTGVGGAGVEAPLVRQMTGGVVPGTVRGYESDLGEMDIVGNRWVPQQAQSAFIYSDKTAPNYQTIAESDTKANGGIGDTTGAGAIWVLTDGLINIAWIDKPHVEDIAKRGDALYATVVAECTLEVNAPFQAHATLKRIADTF